MASDWKVAFDAKSVLPIVNRVVLLARTKRRRNPVIKSPTDVLALLQEAERLDREAFYVLLLDEQRRLIGVYIASIGGSSSAMVDSIVICRAALLTDAKAVVIVHNHPSGLPSASHEDVLITKKLKLALSVFGVVIADHVVVARGGSFSFADAEILHA